MRASCAELKTHPAAAGAKVGSGRPCCFGGGGGGIDDEAGRALAGRARRAKARACSAGSPAISAASPPASSVCGPLQLARPPPRRGHPLAAASSHGAVMERHRDSWKMARRRRLQPDPRHCCCPCWPQPPRDGQTANAASRWHVARWDCRTWLSQGQLHAHVKFGANFGNDKRNVPLKPIRTHQHKNSSMPRTSR